MAGEVTGGLRRGLAARKAMFAGGGGSPYKREVEYIASDGRACCVIPHVHSDSQHCHIETEWVMFDGANIHAKNLWQGAVDDYNWIGGTFSADGLYCGGGSINNYFWFADEGTHTFNLTYDTGVFTAIVDGEEATKRTGGYLSAAMMGIFTQNEGDRPNPISNRTPTGCACRYFKYWDGNNLVADLIPVECNDGSYAFYNRVDGSIIGNAVSKGYLYDPDSPLPPKPPAPPSSGSVYYCGEYGDFQETDIVIGSIVSGSVESGEVTIQFNGAGELFGFDGEVTFSFDDWWVSQGDIGELNVFGEGTMNWWGVEDYWFDIYIKIGG